jgi:hypothetical protein
MATDWNLEAVKVADFIKREIFEAHRGAVQWHNNVVIVFGNDNYTKGYLAKKKVAFVRSCLPGLDPPQTELGFGIDSTEGYTWVLLVRAASEADAKKITEGLRIAVWSGVEPSIDPTSVTGMQFQAQHRIAAAAVLKLEPPE